MYKIRKGERQFAVLAVMVAIIAAGVAFAAHSNRDAIAGHGELGRPAYATPLALAVAVNHSGVGVTVGKVVKSPDQGLLPSFNAVDYDVKLSWGGKELPTGFIMFGDHANTILWNQTSQRLGGVAVVGDNWAISLPTYNHETFHDDAKLLKASKALAPKLAKALGADASLTE